MIKITLDEQEVGIKLKKNFATPRIELMLSKYKSLNMQKIARENELNLSDQSIIDLDSLMIEAKENQIVLAAKIKKSKSKNVIKKLTAEEEELTISIAQLTMIKTFKITQDDLMIKYDNELEKLQQTESFYRPIIEYAYDISEEHLNRLAENSSVNIIAMMGFFLNATIEYENELKNALKVAH